MPISSKRVIFFVAVALASIYSLVVLLWGNTPGFSGDSVERKPTPECVLCGKVPLVTLRKRRLVTDEKRDLRPYYETTETQVSLNVSRTAIISIDMWDNHPCQVDAKRILELGPIVNKNLNAARALGIQVVHGPSEVLAFYKDHPARLHTRKLGSDCKAKRLPTKKSKIRWEPPKKPAFAKTGCIYKPIQSRRKLNTRQNKVIFIDDKDLIIDPDSPQELFCIMEKMGIDTLLYGGVQTDVCVTHRKAGMITARKLGFKTIIVPEITQCNNNPAEPPYLDYGPACDIIVKYVENHIATEGSLIQ